MISRKQLERWDMPLGDCVTERGADRRTIYGFGGSGNKSSSSASTSTSSTTNNLDQRQVVDGGSFGFSNSDGNLVQLLDGGAIAGMGTVASNALAAMGITANGSNTVANTALTTNGNVVSNALAAMGITANGSNTVANTALTTNGNVVSNALAAMGITASTAIDKANSGGLALLEHATELLTSQSAIQHQDFQSILGATLTLSKQAADSAAANLSLAKDLNTASQSAYADASSQAAGNKNLVMAGMVVVGIAAVSFLGKH